MSLSIIFPDIEVYIEKYYDELFYKKLPVNGLGNILFRLASQYGLAKKYNLKMNHSNLNKNIKLGITINMFSNWPNTILRNIDLNTTEEKNNFTIKENKCHIYDVDITKKIIENKDKNIEIKDSYLQSIFYFDNYKENIIELFSPDNNSLDKIYLKYPQLLEINTINISIHLRLQWSNNITYNSKFIIDAINYIKIKLKTNNIIFFVFSDDLEKAQDILSNININFIYCYNNYDYIDMWIMSLCNHNIICHSTLGWWGAYLNKNLNKLVLYPSDIINFYSNLTNVEPILLKKNYIPNDWISINSSSLIY